jgi:two-component system, chemotaxis family, protein-glutamate methylesterase/glutaminase
VAGHDIVVVGASVGGVQALSTLVGDLHEDFPGSMFIALHMGPHSGTALPQILGRRTKLRVGHPRDGEPIERNRVYVAPPGHHIRLTGGRIRVASGPRENGYRPSADILFRSAAAGFGPRVAGVVLSGTRDDGTAGLRAIHQRGGLAIVQDPTEARFPGMPQSAVAGDDPDYVLPIGAIGELVSELARHGCRVGHGFSAESLQVTQRTDVEAALWTAYRALEERVAVLRRLSDRARGRHAEITAEHFKAEAADVGRQADVLRAVLWSRPANEGESLPTHTPQEGRRESG